MPRLCCCRPDEFCESRDPSPQGTPPETRLSIEREPCIGGCGGVVSACAGEYALPGPPGIEWPPCDRHSRVWFSEKLLEDDSSEADEASLLVFRRPEKRKSKRSGADITCGNDPWT
jgi:hypothetical protein